MFTFLRNIVNIRPHVKKKLSLNSALSNWRLTFVLMGIIVGVWLVSRKPSAVEEYYFNAVYPWITLLLTAVSSRFPFSISEITAYAGIVGLVWSTILLLHKKIAWRRWIIGWINFLLFLVVWFYLAWGLNYFRPSLMHRFQGTGHTITEEEFFGVLQIIIQESNAAHVVVLPGDIPGVNSAVEEAYRRYQATYHVKRISGFRRPKRLMVNYWLNKFLTSGFFSPWFHEVHYNADLPPFELPFVLAHEKAHQMGYAREAEASFVAFMACAGSPDPRVRYSAFFHVLGRFLRRARGLRNATMDSLYQTIAAPVRKDMETSRRFWLAHSGRLGTFSRWTYDAYLRGNRVPGGIKNYAGVVDYVLRWYLERRSSGLPPGLEKGSR